MTEFKPGEIVDIHIKGACVYRHVDALGNLEFTYPGPEGTSFECVVVVDADAVTVERVVWPPRPGDLWRDAEGLLWFAGGWIAESVLLFAADGRGDKHPDAVRSQCGPLTLVHREEASES